jgi:hypothetical protein
MWVIPTSSSTPSDRRGLAFCPDCYNEDEVAYYRKRWRYSFNPICPEHKRFLLQTCPACKNPYHYLQYASKPLSNTDINTCNICNTKLSIVAPPETADPFVMASILDVQQRLWSGIETGTFEVGEYKIPSLAYLRVLHSLTNTLLRPAHIKWVTEHYSAVIPEKLNMSKLIDYELYIAPPEMQRPQESGVLIYIADLLIRDWPSDFLRHHL